MTLQAVPAKAHVRSEPNDANASWQKPMRAPGFAGRSAAGLADATGTEPGMECEV